MHRKRGIALAIRPGRDGRRVRKGTSDDNRYSSNSSEACPVTAASNEFRQIRELTSPPNTVYQLAQSVFSDDERSPTEHKYKASGYTENKDNSQTQSRLNGDETTSPYSHSSEQTNNATADAPNPTGNHKGKSKRTRPTSQASNDDMSNAVTGTAMRSLRACMVCSIVKTQQEFLRNGCPNCESFLELAGSQEAVADCTSQVFEGLITVSDTSKSWAARYQRLEGYVPGVYAVQVEGVLPEEVVVAAENAGVNYIPRDGTVSEALPTDG
jgi:transcription elongation factor SPT4